MYIPRAFEVTDNAGIGAFLAQNSFASLVSVIDGEPFATHLPLVYDASIGDKGSLLGHVALANPHWRAFEAPQSTLAIFQGPHAYISPHWYETQPAVPTWNYTAVHVYGSARLMSEAELADFVDMLTAIYESGVNPESPYAVPTQTRDGLIKGIVGFVLEASRIEAKFKLSQNRSTADQHSVSAHLSASTHLGDRDLGQLMASRLRG